MSTAEAEAKSKKVCGSRKKKGGTKTAKTEGNGGRGPIVNGFATIPEADPLQCAEENIADHTLPADAITFIPHRDEVITPFKNGDKERKIHCNIELTQQEVEQVKALQEEARKQGVEFYPSVTAMATRFLSRARGDAKKGLKLMMATQEWRSEFFAGGPVSDTDVMEDIRNGIVYFCGRDRALRPIIVLRPARIPKQWYKENRIDKFVRILIFCMEYFMRYMIVPGRVENLSVLADLKGLGIRDTPIGVIEEVSKVMSHNYLGRVFKFYICNLSPALSMIAGVAKKFLTDRQKQKIQICDSVDDLRKEVALHQLEQDLGGSRPPASTFFPFPLQPGPFEAGDSSGPKQDAVPNVHQVLTREGARGRLWNPRESTARNQRLEYTDKAAEILRRCNIPLPDELQEALQEKEQKLVPIAPNPSLDSADNTTVAPDRVDSAHTSFGADDNASLKPGKEGERSPGHETTMATLADRGNSSTDDEDKDEEAAWNSDAEEDPKEDKGPDLEDRQVMTQSTWSCRPCWCAMK